MNHHHSYKFQKDIISKFKHNWIMLFLSNSSVPHLSNVTRDRSRNSESSWVQCGRRVDDTSRSKREIINGNVTLITSSNRSFNDDLEWRGFEEADGFITSPHIALIA